MTHELDVQAVINRCTHRIRRYVMGTILVILLVLLLIGAVPSWPYSRSWGYYPSGLLGLVLLVVIILALVGRL
jgi:hypothetical protein